MTQLTKTINITSDALAVIARMTWGGDAKATVGVLPEGQLDRKLYESVNKGLAALGGKWNRKAKGHLFDHDPRNQIADMINTGSVDVVKDGFFETPVKVARKMISLLRPTGRTILEPSAGRGALCAALCDELNLNPSDIHVCEKNECRAEILQDSGYWFEGYDFLKLETVVGYPTIVMNPPFENSQDIQHVMHAWDCLEDYGQLVSVMGQGVRFREHKTDTAFRDFVDKHGYFCAMPEGSFKESGTNVNTCLVYLSKGE